MKKLENLTFCIILGLMMLFSPYCSTNMSAQATEEEELMTTGEDTTFLYEGEEDSLVEVSNDINMDSMFASKILDFEEGANWLMGLGGLAMFFLALIPLMIFGGPLLFVVMLIVMIILIRKNRKLKKEIELLKGNEPKGFNDAYRKN